MASGYGIDPKRILQLTDLLPGPDQHRQKDYGQTVFDLYKKLYSEEFQFVRRHKHNIIGAKAVSRTFDGFVACLFGDFPRQTHLKYFAQAFRDAFDPKDEKIDASRLANLYQSSFSSALRMGAHGLDADYNDHSEPTLFILNANEPRDLLDFWNYRAVHRSGIPIPVQWLPELSAFCKEFILANYRPLPNNPNGVMIQPTSIFSRSILEADIEGLHTKYLRVDKQGANALQTWYPPIWQPPPQYMVRRTRPTITAAEKRFNISVDIEKPHIRFDSLSPEFAARFGGEARWANVIRLRDWSFKDRIATVFPTDFKVRSMPAFRLGGEHLLSTTEGLVEFPDYKESSNYWTLTDGKEAIELWLKAGGITCQLSESGRATQQIIQTLGGFRNVQSIAHKQIVGLLDGMARRPIARSAHHHKFENAISAATKGDIWRGRELETLVKHRAVELGYELKCAKCGNWSWYALNELAATMTCDLCLQAYPFPLTNPSSSIHARWAYRVAGPFALPNYAAGGYAAALAIRFFAECVGHGDRAGTTWSPGQELTLADGKKVEVDFFLWYQRKHAFSADEIAQIVIGEAKSLGKDAFKEEDVARVKMLANRYPGAICVFATMKEVDELSRDEIKRLRKLAEWGREYDREDRLTRAPVIVLTGTELFAAHYLETTWKEKGGKHKQLTEPGYVQLDNLLTLADATQQLYLGMPSYFEWRKSKWEQRNRRRQRR